MQPVTVDIDWLEAVRDLLYELAHQEGELAQKAEGLGQSIPAFIDQITQHEQD